MFKINIRITDDIDGLKAVSIDFFNEEWGFVEGFVDVTIGKKHVAGCVYHENPMREGEIGAELVNWWIDEFLKCAIHLPKTKYYSFHEIETYNRWIEVKLAEDIVYINVAEDIKEREIGTVGEVVRVKPYDNYIYEESDVKVKFDEFLHEIHAATKKFFHELEAINPELLKTKMAKELLILQEEANLHV